MLYLDCIDFIPGFKSTGYLTCPGPTNKNGGASQTITSEECVTALVIFGAEKEAVRSC